MHRRTWLRSALGASAACFAQRARAEDAQGPTPNDVPSAAGTEAATLAPAPSEAPAPISTLRPELQRAASKLLAVARPLAGAAVLVDVRSGELLALDEYRGRTGLPNPLYTAVPAASVFKLVTTTALFERGKVNPKTRVCIAGGEHSIEREHLEPPTGPALCSSFFSALGFSRNAAFAQLATQHLPRAALLETAERFGFNRSLPFESQATVGSLDLPYNDLEFARAAAGFQGSLLTPIGAAFIALAIAHGGEPLRLRLNTIPGAANRPLDVLPRIMSATTAWRLARMMEVTIHSGTSRHVFVKEDGKSYLGNIAVAGKTGTLRPEGSATTTSWFMGFAPSRAPEVAVAVMLQNGQVWRRKANEIARDLLCCYFADRPLVVDPFAKPLLATSRP